MQDFIPPKKLKMTEIKLEKKIVKKKEKILNE